MHCDSRPQPALGVVRGRRITNRQIARRLGCTQDWVSRVLLGHVAAPARFRTGLAELLGVEEGDLFR
jgi:transcriptional regulator with XRE-family HTH domain